MAVEENRKLESLRDHCLARNIVYGGGGFGILVLTWLFGLVFFGNPSQSSTAKTILETFGTAFGGGGIIYFVIHGIQRYFFKE